MIGIPAPARFGRHPFAKDIVEEIRRLRPDNWHAVLYLLKDYAVIFGFAYLTVAISWWLYPLSVLMIGAHQRGLSTLLHDSAHGVLTRNRALNFFLGTLPTAWPILQRHFAYRESHVLTHHPYLGRADRDPDLEFFIAEGVFTPRSDPAFLLHVVVLPMLGSKTWAYLKYLVRNRYQMLLEQFGARPACRTDWQYRFDSWGFSFFWLAVTGTSAALGIGWYLIAFWLVPYITSFHILGWFIEMSEHCSATEQRSVNLVMARNRRSRHLEKWLTGINNDDFHLDHHLDPTTPFWLLSQAHRIRLRDRVYAAHCRQTGGLFQSAADGAPSIIALMRAQNRVRYQAQLAGQTAVG
jgi:dihydrorhizobitoxine desaturase